MDVLVTWIGFSDLRAPNAGPNEVGPLARILKDTGSTRSS